MPGRKGQRGIGERRLLRGVTMLQTALTLALLVGAGLLIRTMVNIARVPSGYNTGRILTMSVTTCRPGQLGHFHRRRWSGSRRFRRAVRGVCVGSSADRQQLAGDFGNRRAASRLEGKRQVGCAVAGRHAGLFQVDGRDR